jgi:hypothetical protein
MSEQGKSEQEEAINGELDDIFGPQDQELVALVNEMIEQASAESIAKGKKDRAKAAIILKMDEMGVLGLTIAGRKLGFKTQTYIGVHREDPELREEFKVWMEKYAPSINIPAVTAVKKAMEIWEDENPGVEMPRFLKKEERRSFFNRKA